MTQRPISDYQIKKLESIGMQWRVQGAEWEENFEAAKRYFEEHGDLNVPRGFRLNDDGINLNSWLIIQRKKFRAGKLSKEQIKKLDSIGMDWDGRNRNSSEIAVTLEGGKRVAV